VYVGYGSQQGLTEENVKQYFEQFGGPVEWVTQVPLKACMFVQLTPSAFELVMNDAYYPGGQHQIGNCRVTVRQSTAPRTTNPNSRADALASDEFANCSQVYVGYGGQGAIISPQMVMKYLGRFGVVRWVSHLPDKSCMFAEFTSKEMAQACVRHSNVGQHVVGQAVLNINPVKRAFVVNPHDERFLAGPGIVPDSNGQLVDIHQSHRVRVRAEASAAATAVLEGCAGVHLTRPAIDHMLGQYGIDVHAADEDASQPGDWRLSLRAEDSASLAPFEGGPKSIPYAGTAFVIRLESIDSVPNAPEGQQQETRPQPQRQAAVMHDHSLFVPLTQQQQATGAVNQPMLEAHFSRIAPVVYSNTMRNGRGIFLRFQSPADAQKVLSTAVDGQVRIGNELVLLRPAMSRVTVTGE